MLLSLCRFDDVAKDADMIITGEGHADRQTLMGKLPQKVLQRGQQMGVPVGLVAGRVDAKEQLLEAGFRFAESVTPDGMSTAEAMKKEVAQANLRRWADFHHHHELFND